MTTAHASTQSMAWLPSRHEPPLLEGPLNHKYIKEHKINDWFLTLHDAMPKKYEARMMVKVYLFLCQYMPEGLTGRWAHLRGSEVMSVLLSDEEPSVSRHKATKKIYSSLGKLEVWMAKGPSWRIASENSKVEAKKMKPHTAKRDKLEKAPLPLYSPERCLAFLVLAYPDPKYRDKFQCLQLGWMMDDPKTLDVQDQGFWWGLDSRAACSVFLPEKPLRANETKNCSLDYDVLFGASFPKCREDIKPYLPSEEWAQGLCLGTEDTDDGTVDGGAVDDADAAANTADDTSSDPDGEETDGQNARGLALATAPAATATGDDDDRASTAASSAEISSAPEGPPDPTGTWTEDGIARHLSADNKSDEAVPGWVAHLLGQTCNSFTVMRTWCCFWQKRMSTAKTAEEQLLTRSLIWQGARIIKSFHASSATKAADAYMLLDMSAWDELSEGYPEPRSNLTRIPHFAAYSEAKSQLTQLLGGEDEDAANLCGNIFSQQAKYFYSIQKDGKLFRQAKYCMKLAEIRLRIFSRSFVPGRTPALLPHRRLWDGTVLSALQVSHWQALAAMQPAADLRSILAEYQLLIYNEKYEAGSPALLINDASRKPALPPQSYEGECGEKDRGILTALFGALEPQAPRQSTLPLLSVPKAENTQHQPVTASPEPEPPALQSPNTTSHHSKRKSLASHPRQDTNPYAPQNPKRKVSRNEQSTKVPCLEGGSDKPQRQPSTASSMGNSRNPYANTISPTARPPRVASRESVLREEVRGLKEKLDQFLEAQDKIREDAGRMIEEKLESKIQAFASTIESQLNVLSTLHTERHEDLVNMINTKLVSNETLGRTIEDHLKLSRKSYDEKLAQTNQGVITAVTEQFLKMKEVDETAVRKIGSKFDEIKIILSKVPSVGQEGYLARHCPAPGTMAPAAYEHTLVRAAIYYFGLFADADNPLVKDYGAMEETMDRYPNVVPEHIDVAIDHLHFIAYGHSIAER
ncbi:hypothetical protein F5Y12DRAFT_139095 [Xylaria sp. FL1777]|nr:hypothetical protein F5Y12DRAFT_139095 [Xylaria sp. FL1777]